MRTNDKLYRYVNGAREIVTFLSEGLADLTCSLSTYLCRNAKGERFRCSPNMYASTEREALERYIKEVAEGIESMHKQITELEDMEWDAVALLEKLEARLETL
jgi:hypothetical protein